MVVWSVCHRCAPCRRRKDQTDDVDKWADAANLFVATSSSGTSGDGKVIAIIEHILAVDVFLLTNSYLCARNKIHGAGMKFDRSIYNLVQLQGRRWRKFYRH
jgi:hypothetical protein